MKTVKAKSSGFTLIELMIVVAIIGILSSVAITSYSNYVATAKDKAVIGNLDIALAYVRNEISKNIGSPSAVTVSGLLTELNAGTASNPCQKNQAAFVLATSLPSDPSCFVTLEEQGTAPRRILVAGYDRSGQQISISSGDIQIE